MNLSISALLAAYVLTPSAMASERASSASQSYWVEQVAEGFNLPSSMVWLPNGDALITERMGDLRILRKDKLDPTPVRGVPASHRDAINGLKDIVLDPDFAASQTLYLFVSEGSFERRHASVYRARYTATGLQDVERIFRSKDEIGGTGIIATRMIFLPDKTLLFGVAEDHKQRAQNLGSHLGKFLRINRDGSVPPDNPFVHAPGALPEIWSYGHRVPTGVYRDSLTGEIWECEPGPRGGDEINILKPGANYGWAKTSWGFAYGNDGLDAPFQTAAGIENPVVVWTPSVTPAGLMRYVGSVYPAWSGDYFVGYLSGRALERLRFDGHRAILQERMLFDLGEGIRDIKVGPDQRIYLLTNSTRLLRLQPGRPGVGQASRVARQLESTTPAVALSDVQPGDPVQGQQSFIERCAMCHSVGNVVRGGQVGPDLANVYGNRMGRKEGFDYSPNMAGAVFEWNAALLSKMMLDPQSVVPGTRMALPPVTDAQTRSQIIGFLQRESTNETTPSGEH